MTITALNGSYDYTNIDDLGRFDKEELLQLVRRVTREKGYDLEINTGHLMIQNKPCFTVGQIREAIGK